MKVKDFINEINSIYPDIDKNEVASDVLISEKEKILGYKLPNSFKTFLKEFSNGILLLDAEPIGGVGEDDDSPCGSIFSFFLYKEKCYQYYSYKRNNNT